MKTILSYGGGICSTGMLLYLLEQKRDIDLIIHADTGEERESTHETIKQIKKISEEKKIEFVIVSSSLGNLYDYYFKHKVIMSSMKRDCTSKFKISPMRNYIRNKYGKKETFEMLIGYTIEEFHRCKPSDVKYIKNIYPMVEDRISRDDCIRLLRKYEVTASKSACKGCIFTKLHEWRNMIKSNSDEFERHKRLEENGRGYPKITLYPRCTLEDIKNGWFNQELLEDPEPSCDVSAGCFL